MDNHLPAILKAIEYIESHLKDNLNIGDVADHVGFSKYHFTRVFKDVTSLSPSEYYRGRKVTQAIDYMQTKQCKIIDAAFEYGFNSPEVFTRSCLSAFDQSPSQIKKSIGNHTFTGLQPLTEKQLRVYNKYEHINITPIMLPPIFIKGISYTTHDLFDTLDWDNPVIKPLINTSETIYHLHWLSKETPDLYHHLVGTSINLDDTFSEEDFSSYVYKKIPGREYLVFPLMEAGKELESMKDYIYDYYMPQNKYASERLFNIEAISFGDDHRPKKSKLYVPAKRKNRR